MNVSKVSHHPLTVKHRAVWLASLTVSHGGHRLLAVVVDAVLRGKAWQASQERTAGMFHCSRRSVIRYAKELVALGFVRMIRRGKKLTNVYRLSRWLWERLTGRHNWQRAPVRQLTVFHRPLTESPSRVELDEHERKKRAALSMLSRAAVTA